MTGTTSDGDRQRRQPPHKSSGSGGRQQQCYAPRSPVRAAPGRTVSAMQQCYTGSSSPGRSPPPRNVSGIPQSMASMAAMQQALQQEQQQYAAPAARGPPSCVTRRMADTIHEEVRSMVATSRLVRKSEGIGLVHRHELTVVGDMLGQGAFSEVHRVTYRNGCSLSNLSADEQLSNSSEASDGLSYYAMKHLRGKLKTQPDNFRLAASELAMEAHMLASFRHPNIIAIHGWAANGIASFGAPNASHDSFFLLLDCLEETLESRIERWKQQSKRRKVVATQSEPLHMMAEMWRRFSTGGGGGSGDGDKQSAESRMNMMQKQQRELDKHEDSLLRLEKISIISEIASALSYLHNEANVVYRDLKPNNIGFLHGRVKLFDFGLSRELPEANDLTTPYEMSGKVGTLRYMATEVACHLPYNVAADVYSWAMVSYEILTLMKPFAGWTREMHSKLVCGRNVRPELSGNGIDIQPSVMKPILEACWHPTPHVRPSMAVVHNKMQQLEQQELLYVQQHPVSVQAQELQAHQHEERIQRQQQAMLQAQQEALYRQQEQQNQGQYRPHGMRHSSGVYPEGPQVIGHHFPPRLPERSRSMNSRSPTAPTRTMSGMETHYEQGAREQQEQRMRNPQSQAHHHLAQNWGDDDDDEAMNIEPLPVSVELPHDFAIDSDRVRKPPQRNHSEAFTRSTMSMTSSIASMSNNNNTYMNNTTNGYDIVL